MGYEHRWTPATGQGVYTTMMVSEHPADNLQQNRAMRRLPPAGLKSTRIVSPLEMRSTFGTENGQLLSEMVNTGNIRTSCHYDKDNPVEQETLEEKEVKSPGEARPAKISPCKQHNMPESPVSLVQ